MTALQELLAKVKAGGCFLLTPCHKTEQLGGGKAYLCRDAYSGSLDAAKALHDTVLPGWRYNIWNDGAHVRHDKNKILGNPVDWNCPARAWLIAIIEALIAQEAANARIAMIPNGAGARMDEMERQDHCPDDGAIEVGKLMEQTT